MSSITKREILIAAKKQIEENHRDAYGRITLRPASQTDSLQENFDNNNMLLYSGEVLLVYSMLGIATEEDYSKFESFLGLCEVEPGLYSRHPVKTKWFRSKHHDVVSHDEYNGVMFAACSGAGFLVSNVILYGNKNLWMFNDKEPGKSWDNMRYWRQPRDVGFYKACSNISSPNWFERAYMALAIMMTTRDKSYNKSDGSSMMMVLYRIWALEHIGFDCWMFRYAAKFFRRKLKKRLGPDWISKLHSRYFHSGKIPGLHVLVSYLN